MEVHEVETEIRALPHPVSIVAQRNAILPLVFSALVGYAREHHGGRNKSRARVIFTRRDAIGTALPQRIADGEERAAGRQFRLLMLIDIHGFHREVAGKAESRIGRALGQEDFLQFKTRLIKRRDVEGEV